MADQNGVTPLHLATVISRLKKKEALINPIDPAQSTAGAKAAIAASVATATGVIVAGALYDAIRLLKAKAYIDGMKAILESATTVIMTGRELEAVRGSKPFYALDILQDGWFTTKTLGALIAAAVAIAVGTMITVDIVKRNRIAALLLGHKADPNAQDMFGNTPLHTLADGKLLKPGDRHGGIILARHLLRKGANLLTPNKDGKTPYDLARANNRFLLKSLLDRP